jgi:hypothetical protein
MTSSASHDHFYRVNAQYRASFWRWIRPRLVIPMCLVSDALLAQLHALCEREHFVDLLSPVIRA